MGKAHPVGASEFGPARFFSGSEVELGSWGSDPVLSLPRSQKAPCPNLRCGAIPGGGTGVGSLRLGSLKVRSHEVFGFSLGTQHTAGTGRR